MRHDRFDEGQILPDNRFRSMLGAAAWEALPAAVRARFGKRLRGGASVVYQGKVVAMRMTLAGAVLAQVARLVGAPLPYDRSSVGRPAIVSVTEDCAGEGQFWIRQYGRASGFPHVVHSSKRFAGPTGIEEYIGAGIGMALTLAADHESLRFLSDHYFVRIGAKKLRVPGWLCPGALEIVHRDLGGGAFQFSLTLRSRLFGELIYQDAVFHDIKE